MSCSISSSAGHPYLAQYSGADGGKIAHYMFRWINSTGEKGPWSETAGATISA